MLKILLFQQLTTNNENDYYLLKEVTEAAMIDAIDIPYDLCYNGYKGLGYKSKTLYIQGWCL